MIDVWENKGNLPVISEKKVIERVLKVKEKGRAILKIPKDRREKSLEKLEKIKEDSKVDNKDKVIKAGEFLQDLFDICTCSCNTLETCKCPKDKKVPALEWSFLQDQRNNRDMRIGGVDVNVIKLWQKR